MSLSVSVVIPTLNAEREIAALIGKLKNQTVEPIEIIVVDSASDDSTVDAARKSGAEVIEIDRDDFNHGLTRDMALRHSTGEVVCFMTQDAVPVDDLYIENIIKPILEDESVAVVSGRQLPKPDARKFERLVREFNYGPESNTRSIDDIPKLGIKAFFATDVCSAYRRSLYLELGGFPKTNMSEDMFMAALAVRGGYKVAYSADACVLHSHNLTPSAQFNRNRAIGRFLESNKELLDCSSEVGEGGKLVKFVSRKLIEDGDFGELMSFGIDCAARLVGNRMGRRDIKIQDRKRA